MEKAFRLEKATACVLYQKGIFDPIVIAGETMTGMEIRQNLNASQTVLDIMILDRAEGISLRLEYIETLYERESMERFGKLLARIIQKILPAAAERENAGISGLISFST